MGRAGGGRGQGRARREPDARVTAAARACLAGRLQAATRPGARRHAGADPRRQAGLQVGQGEGSGRGRQRVTDPALTELADRLAIQDLIARYPLAVDGRDWDALDELFTPDARIDFTAFGGPAGDLASTKSFPPDAPRGFRPPPHTMGVAPVPPRGGPAPPRPS